MFSSASTDPFDPSFNNLPGNEQLSVCKTWLDSNQSHPLRHMIEDNKNLLETIKYRLEKIKKLDEKEGVCNGANIFSMTPSKKRN